MDQLDMSEELKILLNKVLVAEGDITKTCSISRAPVKKIVLEEISSAVLKLEAHIMLNISANKILR